jgi:hypothetical protein
MRLMISACEAARGDRRSLRPPVLGSLFDEDTHTLSTNDSGHQHNNEYVFNA